VLTNHGIGVTSTERRPERETGERGASRFDGTRGWEEWEDARRESRGSGACAAAGRWETEISVSVFVGFHILNLYSGSS
jgi:hypothetical protein